MIQELRYVVFDTEIGWIGILSSRRGLRRTTLPQPSAEEARQLLAENEATWAPYPFDDLVQRLRTYLGGHKVTFPDRLDLSQASTFQRRVWQMTRLIPYGSTRSYIWVAEQIKKPGAFRAVGQALAKNPLPIIIPCHRVLTSGGKLGGYSGGVEMKQYLLRLEATVE